MYKVAGLPGDVTVVGILSAVFAVPKIVDPVNVVTVLRIVILLNRVQLLNAESPIEFVLVGIVIAVRLVLWKTDEPIKVTLDGIVNDDNFEQPLKRLLFNIEIVVDCISIDVRLLHKVKQLLSIDVTLEGIVIDVNAKQRSKALVPIDFTLLGIVIDINTEQLKKRKLLNLEIVVDCMLTDVSLVHK